MWHLSFASCFRQRPPDDESSGANLRQVMSQNGGAGEAEVIFYDHADIYQSVTEYIDEIFTKEIFSCNRRRSFT
jgi:hypothetical protein